MAMFGDEDYYNNDTEIKSSNTFNESSDDDDDSFNISTVHSIYAHPSMSEYYSNLTPFVTLAIFVATLLFMLNLSIYCTTIAKLRRRLRASKRLLGPSIAMCGFYPIISFAALVTILVPKSWLICHTVMHLCFTLAACIFRGLCFRYVESEVNYVKETDGAAVQLNTPPCCCCCPCLPACVPSKAKLCILRYMVWQMPFVQGSVMMVLNAIYYRDSILYTNVMVFFIPFIITSILLGMWGLNITVRMVNSLRADYGLMKKMFCVQLIILLCKLQYLLLDSQLNAVPMGGDYPINHTIYKQTVINMLILAEMVLVSMLTQSAYKIPVQIDEIKY